jgi:Protein of unknown function (DUF2490)
MMIRLSLLTFRTRNALLLLVTMAVSPVSAWASDGPLTNDLGVWTPVTLVIPVNEKLRFNTAYFAWYDRNLSRSRAHFVEAIPTVQIKPWLTAGAGVRYIHIPAIDSGEWMGIQQAEATHPLGPVRVSHRLRAEEIMRPQESGLATRGRYRLSTVLPLSGRDGGKSPSSPSRWTYETVSEAIITLDGEPWRPTGDKFYYHQQKIGYRVTDWLVLKGGYVLAWQQEARGADGLSHIILTEAVVQLPPLSP